VDDLGAQYGALELAGAVLIGNDEQVRDDEPLAGSREALYVLMSWGG
jgi:hypothetical protein